MRKRLQEDFLERLLYLTPEKFQITNFCCAKVYSVKSPALALGEDGLKVFVEVRPFRDAPELIASFELPLEFADVSFEPASVSLDVELFPGDRKVSFYKSPRFLGKLFFVTRSGLCDAERCYGLEGPGAVAEVAFHTKDGSLYIDEKEVLKPEEWEERLEWGAWVRLENGLYLTFVNALSSEDGWRPFLALVDVKSKSVLEVSNYVAVPGNAYESYGPEFGLKVSGAAAVGGEVYVTMSGSGHSIILAKSDLSLLLSTLGP